MVQALIMKRGDDSGTGEGKLFSEKKVSLTWQVLMRELFAHYLLSVRIRCFVRYFD